MPGLFAGIIIVFMLCLGFYVTPALLGGGSVMMWSMQIGATSSIYSDWGAASALGVVLLAMTLGILWRVARLVGLDRIVGGAVDVPRPATETQITHAAGSGSTSSPALMLLFLIAAEPARRADELLELALPRVSAARLVDCAGIEAYFGAVEWRDATAISFEAAVLTMLVSTALGTLAAYGLHMLGSALRRSSPTRLRAAAHDSGDPDRDRRLHAVRASSGSTTPHRHRPRAFDAGDPAGRDPGRVGAARATT